MIDTGTERACGYSHYDDEEVICDLCDQQVTPSCAAIRIATGHMESPIGDRGFEVCLDCAGQQAGFLLSIAILGAEVTDRWEAKKVPYREYHAARRAAKEAYQAATTEQRAAFAAVVSEAAARFKETTGQDAGKWDLDPAWPA